MLCMQYKLPDLNSARKRSKNQVLRRKFEIKEEYKEIGKGKYYLIKTHGCQANERDSENLAGMLEDIGYTFTDEESKADLVIINTCAIRSGAEDKVWGELGALKRYKSLNPTMIIGLCGCMAQEEKTCKDILEKYRQVDLIFGTHNIDDLPALLAKAQKEKTIEVNSFEGEVVEDLPSKRVSKYKALVNIMYGCDKFCAYCIVPYTRGKERSRLIEDVLKEVQELKDNGYKEITLLGQNVNAYGKDLNLGYDFATLLEKVAQIGIPRVRFMTSHPWDFNDQMIEVIKNNPNIMPYIHLPLQSGSDSVLRKMNRRYTEESYMALFDKLKNNLPHFAFTTDIIVAFPTETNEDFERTLNMVDHCKYDNAFTFIFSPREGTPAYNMENTIPEEEKKDRLRRLNEKVAYYANMNAQKYQDKIVEVLVYGPSKKNKDIMCGYSKEFKVVNFIGDCKEGDIVNVKITKANSFSLNGEMVK